jgi:hypothetical protein
VSASGNPPFGIEDGRRDKSDLFKRQSRQLDRLRRTLG